MAMTVKELKAILETVPDTLTVKIFYEATGVHNNITVASESPNCYYKPYTIETRSCEYVEDTENIIFEIY